MLKFLITLQFLIIFTCISNTDYGAYIVDSFYRIIYTIISYRQASHIDFIKEGKACLSLIFSNMEWIEMLKKKCPSSSIDDSSYFSKHWIQIYFFDFQSRMDLFDEGFKECFYLQLILHIAKLHALAEKQENPYYQEFWQNSLREAFFNLNASNDETKRLIMDVKALLPSFNDKTKEIYYSIATLYDLKGIECNKDLT